MSKLSLTNKIHESPQSTARFLLNKSLFATWRSQFFALPLNRLAQNICTAGDPIGACLRQDVRALDQPGKQRHQVEVEIKATTDGPSWICTGLDLLRLAMQKDCELSVAYLIYWHKLERCNYVLHSVVELLAQCEPLDGRTFQYLMKHTVPDGGNWQMFVNLVQKYGVMPKLCYVASWSSTRTLHLNKMLKSKLHEFSSKLHAQFTFDGDDSNLSSMIEPMIEELYKIISICLGTPPLEFTWSFKQEEDSQTYTPLGFYQLLVAPFYNLGDKICLRNDPRPSSSYHRNYLLAYSSNMIGGLQQSYNNQSMDTLLGIMVASLSAGAGVWLTCDLHSVFYGKTEVLSLTTHNFEQVFGITVGEELDKGERLIYKGTRPNTVLLLTEVTLDAMKQPLQFRTIAKVKETAKKAQSHTSLQLSDQVTSETGNRYETEVDAAKRKTAKSNTTALNVDWLREYAFEIVVDSRFVPSGVLHAIRSQSRVELPIWDPMGALLS